MYSTWSMCKCSCESCFLQRLLERCVGRHITVNNIRDERISNTAWARWQLTNDMCSGNVCKCHRACIKKRAPVCLSNGLTLGSREIDDLIKISCLSFAPVYNSFLYVSIALCSLFFPCSLTSVYPPFFRLSNLFSLARHSSQPLYTCFQKGWDGSPPSQKWLPFTVHFVCVLPRTLTSPVENAMTWQWWRGWMEGELHAVKSEANTANTEKNNSTNGSPYTLNFYWHCKEGWLSID